MPIDYTRALGYEQLTSLGSAVAITGQTGAQVALIQAESQDIRWRDDGTAPTATVGMLLAAGDILEYDAALITRVQLIQVAASAKANVSYYGF